MPGLKIIYYGASPISENVLRRAMEVFGTEFVQLYGMTETTGTVVNLVSSSEISLAVSYSIGQSAPMVAACRGIFVWREFAGAPAASWVLLGMMFAFYFAAISCIAVSSS